MNTLSTWMSIIVAWGVMSCGGDLPSNGPAPQVTAGDECYSPTQNLDTSYDGGAVGCACGDTDQGQCVPDSTGRKVALVCADNRWAAVVDGPCWPEIRGNDAHRYSPNLNLDTAYDDGALGCVCSGTDQDECMTDSTGRKVALICSDNRWLAVQDGPQIPDPGSHLCHRSPTRVHTCVTTVLRALRAHGGPPAHLAPLISEPRTCPVCGSSSPRAELKRRAAARSV